MVNFSISKTVRDIIDDDLSIQDALQRGYGNISAMARVIKPRVEQILRKRVSFESVTTALKRARGGYGRPSQGIQPVIARSIVNVRTDVAKLSVERTKRNLETVRRLLASFQEEFLQLSESISAVTLIFDKRLFDEIRPMFGGEVLEEELNLAAIIVRSPEEIIKTPGCVIAFYNQLSRRHINIEDTTSCFTDTIMVVRLDDAGKAFNAMAELISNARKSTQKERAERIVASSRPKSGVADIS